MQVSMLHFNNFFYKNADMTMAAPTTLRLYPYNFNTFHLSFNSFFAASSSIEETGNNAFFQFTGNNFVVIFWSFIAIDRFLVSRFFSSKNFNEDQNIEKICPLILCHQKVAHFAQFKCHKSNELSIRIEIGILLFCINGYAARPLWRELSTRS